MQTLDIHRPEMPDLQFTLLVTALCTSRLTALNIPESLRTTIFDRCWVLIHDSPPPDKPEERILDLRPWNEVTLEAMAETIRRVLTDAGIRQLTWDHAPSDSTWASAPEALPLVDQLEQLYHPRSTTSDASGERTAGTTPDRTNESGSEVRRLIHEMAVLMAAFSPALERRAAALEAGGRDAELTDKLIKGAGVMRDSGYMYLTWARHYAALSDENPHAAGDTDETGFGLS
jgi:hypothetical protein